MTITSLSVALIGCAQNPTRLTRAAGETGTKGAGATFAETNNRNVEARASQDPPTEVEETDFCGAQSVQSYIGSHPSGKIRDGMRVRSGAKVVRFVRPGDIVTMEFSGERLTVHLDKRDLISSVACG